MFQCDLQKYYYNKFELSEQKNSIPVKFDGPCYANCFAVLQLSVTPFRKLWNTSQLQTNLTKNVFQPLLLSR